jgi:hypothetical protein
VKITMILATLFIGSLSYAGTIACSGDDYGYDFALTATVTNNQVTGTIPCTVTQNGQTVMTQQLTATSSDIQPGKSLVFAADNSQITGTVNAPYSGGQYVGTLAADTTDGDYTVNVTCTLSE